MQWRRACLFWTTRRATRARGAACMQMGCMQMGCTCARSMTSSGGTPRPPAPSPTVAPCSPPCAMLSPSLGLARAGSSCSSIPTSSSARGPQTVRRSSRSRRWRSDPRAAAPPSDPLTSCGVSRMLTRTRRKRRQPCRHVPVCQMRRRAVLAGNPVVRAGATLCEDPFLRRRTSCKTSRFPHASQFSCT